MECIITYQKTNGDIFIRAYNHAQFKRIGDETSMGWTILDKHFQYYDGNYYHEQDYYRKLRERKKTLKQKTAEYIIKTANKWR